MRQLIGPLSRPLGWLLLAGFMFGVSCAPSLPEEYQRSRAAAERAYSSGRYGEAANHWLAAEKAADRKRDRVEARYRAAASLRRAGRDREAATLLSSLAREYPKSDRAARAAYDQAQIQLEQGKLSVALKSMDDLMVAYPDSGAAEVALARRVEVTDANQGSEACVRYLRQLAARLDKTGLAERVQYSLALQLEKAGQAEAARAQFLYVAKRFPYPGGPHWDDALYRASLLDEQLGDPRAAVARLREMLEEQEPSSLQGSYARPRFDDAQYRIAELYRDRLRDPEGARREFHRVYTDHPTSLLRDDALFNEALLARQAGDQGAACRVLARLVDEFPESRFAPCASLICASATPAKGSCRDYVRRQIEAQR